MNNQQIQTPGVSFLLASQDKSKPYRLRPELWDLKDRGPAWFFENKVQPFVDQGVTDIFLHRMFGETATDGPQDFDTWEKMNEAGGQAEQYAQVMLVAFFRFFQRAEAQPFVYLGSFQADTLSETSNGEKWFDRVWSQVDPFIKYGVVYGVAPHFIFDHASAYKLDSREWSAFKSIRRVLRDRVSIESLPHPDNPEQWKLPSWATELDYQNKQGDPNAAHFRTPEMLGHVTRMLDVPGYKKHWEDNGGVPAFLVDCHRKGHRAFIADGLPRRVEMTIDDMCEAAQKALKMGG